MPEYYRASWIENGLLNICTDGHHFYAKGDDSEWHWCHKGQCDNQRCYKDYPRRFIYQRKEEIDAILANLRG